VTPAWVLMSLALPLIATLAAAMVHRGREARPLAVIILNALFPGAGLAAAHRPTLEVLAGVAFTSLSLITVGRAVDSWMYVPIMFIGGVWGLIHTPFSPFTDRVQSPTAESKPAPSTPHRINEERPKNDLVGSGAKRPSTAPIARDEENNVQVQGYAVVVRCTECGADVEVQVLHHMAHCNFCDSDHLVIGQDQTLFVTLPERITDDRTLKEAVLDHYRYLHYLKLYKRHVAPLERQATIGTPEGAMAASPEFSAAAAAAEQVVTAKADRYRAKLATKVRVTANLHVLAPYRHGMGSLYQAAFGREPSTEEKTLRFAIGSVEAATLATKAADLPRMGKLSYLKALEPAARHRADVRCLPLDQDQDALTTAYGNLDRKQLVRDLRVIRLGVAFQQDVEAVVWRAWWIAGVTGGGIHETLLVDSAAGSVAGKAPHINPAILEPLPDEACDPGGGLHFAPMECPTCGFEFRFDPDAVVHFCHNCCRTFEVQARRKVELGYDHEPPQEGHDMVPFWRFPLRLRTGDDNVVTGLAHLKDGIDGSLDQIGDETPMRQDQIFVPAFRCRHPRQMAESLERMLIFTLRRPPSTYTGRYPLDSHPEPWTVSMAEEEARRFTPLYLATAFNRRDLAKANVHNVTSWLFEGRLEAEGRLCFLNVPQTVTEPFRPYIGRTRVQAVQKATGH